MKTILGDVRVLAVDQTFKEDKDTKTVVGKTATLELTPEQAELVVRRVSTGTLVAKSLRGLGDNDVRGATNAKHAGTDDGPVSVIRYGVESPVTTTRPCRARGRNRNDPPSDHFVAVGGRLSLPGRASSRRR